MTFLWRVDKVLKGTNKSLDRVDSVHTGLPSLLGYPYSGQESVVWAKGGQPILA